MMIYISTLILAVLLGGGVNYLADVLPGNRRLIAPSCSNCNSGYPLTRYILGMSCTVCGQKRPIRFWVVYLSLLLAGTWLVRYPIAKLGTWLSLLLTAYLLLIIVIDIENRLILHTTSLAGSVLGLLVGWKLHGLLSTIIGGMAGFGLMLGMYYLGFLFVRFSRKIRQQQLAEDDAIGFGDVNFSGIMGLSLGWPGVLAGFILAIIIGGAASLFYLLWKITRKEYHPDLALPYGPFLAFSLIILLFIRPLFLH